MLFRVVGEHEGDGGGLIGILGRIGKEGADADNEETLLRTPALASPYPGPGQGATPLGSFPDPSPESLTPFLELLQGLTAFCFVIGVP